MNALSITLVVLQIVLSLILVIVVLFQSGSQTGLSGSIAGGAETFFGKNKGRTIDAQLKKWTAVVAILFLLTSIGLTFTMQQLAPAESNPPIGIEGLEGGGIDVNDLDIGDFEVDYDAMPDGEEVEGASIDESQEPNDNGEEGTSEEAPVVPAE